jgi:hypothetical protein
VGFLYAPAVHQAVPYGGANIYFHPINKDAPLPLSGDQWHRGDLWHRLALTVAVTAESISDSRTRDDLFGNSTSLVLGAGLRVTRSLRIGAGALLFLRRDVNPLINDETVAASPYFSFSFDLNIAKLLGGFFTKFIGGGS